MEKLVRKGKKEIKLLLMDSLHQTVQALGVSKSKKKAEKLIKKSAKRLASEVATQIKKELKKMKPTQEAGVPNDDKVKKEKKVKKDKKAKKKKNATPEMANN